LFVAASAEADIAAENETTEEMKIADTFSRKLIDIFVYLTCSVYDGVIKI